MPGMPLHHAPSGSHRIAPLFLLTLGLAGPIPAQDQDNDEDQALWPRDIAAPTATITIYQPQPESFDGDRLRARAAVSVLPSGSTEPLFGAIWVSARVSTDRDARTVSVLDIDVTKIVFPHASEDKVARLKEVLEKQVGAWNLEISLDRLLTGLDLIEKQSEAAEPVKNDPPEIILSTRPAVLLVLDGEPELRRVEGADLMQVVNTPYFVVLDAESEAYYFFTGTTWMKAADLTGTWREIMGAPARVVAYAKKEGALPEEKIKPTTERAPRIIVRTEPAELIVTAGEPTYTPLRGTKLLYVSNTTSDLLLEIGSRRSFVLLSGRWFSAPRLEGPWSFVPPGELPSEFQKIPAESEKGQLRASIAGTDEAREAVLETQIPQTARIDRNATIEVEYDGTPQWAPIEATSAEYALNTEYDVFRIDHRYYCCHDAVWYESSSPHGPYTVCVEVPTAAYTIPPRYPVYRVRYVYVYRATPTYVYVGYLPGYAGSYVYAGTVVYGTGYRYRGYYGRHIRRVYARPCTWGFAAGYNPWRGAWGFRVGYGYYGGAVVVRGGWWGARGYHRYRARDERRDRVDHRWDRRENIYNDRRDPLTKRYDNRTDLASQRVENRGDRARDRATARADSRAARAAGSPAGQARERSNNVYADRDGNVYRRTNEGWERRTQDGWSKSQPSSAARSATERPTRPTARRSTRSHRSSLDRAHYSRQRGTTRTSTYRSGGRGFRGGGRRR